MTVPDNETELEALPRSMPDVNATVPFAAPAEADDLILTYTFVLLAVPLL